MPPVDPNEVMMTGENSFIRLSPDGGKTLSDRASHWRVLWCPAGGGHALFLQSTLNHLGWNRGCHRYYQLLFVDMRANLFHHVRHYLRFHAKKNNVGILHGLGVVDSGMNLQLLF